MCRPGSGFSAGFYDNLLQGGDLSMEALDQVSTDHPIFVLYVNGHVGAANSAAFKRANIAQNIGEIPGGGHFGRGPDGQLNGLVYEEPALLRFIDLAIPAVTPALIAKALTAYARGPRPPAILRFTNRARSSRNGWTGSPSSRIRSRCA